MAVGGAELALLCSGGELTRSRALRPLSHLEPLYLVHSFSLAALTIHANKQWEDGS